MNPNLNLHDAIDTARPWHVRMAQARRWHLARLTTPRLPNERELLAVAADAIARMPGWRLYVPTPSSIRADYARCIRRNLATPRLPA